MANTVQIKRGNTASVSSYTGPSGEVIYNLDTGRLHAQDGSVAGGHPHALLSDVNTKANASVNIEAGAGLTGGGNLTANRTLNVGAGAGISVTADSVALNAASIASLGKADTALQAPGGTTGQILAKNSNTTNDVGWVSSEAATAVSYAAQTLTDTQKSQARANIDAEKVYNSVSDVQSSVINSSVIAIKTNGYYSAGDGGDALYKRVASEPTHAGKVQSADGAWWEISSVDINVRMFGAKGDGVADDVDAIQAAIDFAAPFVWKGGTRATEEGSGSGSVFFPKGTYRITRKIKLAPNLRIHGEGCGNDWTVRNAATGGATKWGSSIFVDYTNYQDYAIDTCPYHADGIRYNNDTLEGGDSFNGLKTEVHNITIEDISIIGNYTTKGVNLAGGVFSKVRNVFLKGFTVGWRYSAVWYGVHENCRSWVSWKGLIAYISVTDLALDNSSWQKGYDAPAYNVGTMGSDSGLPAVSGWWLQLFNDVTVGITNFYSCLTARNICVEGFEVYSAGRSAVNDFESVYIEGITYIAIISMGPDQSNERHVFDTITTNSGDLVGQSQSKLEVGCRNTPSTQSGFNKLFWDVASDPIYRPVIWGLKLNIGTDVFPQRSMKRSDVLFSEGIWNSTLLAGGASLGTNSVSENRFIRVGNMVTVWGYLVIPTKTGATGNLTIGGLPLPIRNNFGQWSSGVVSFGYLAPAVGSPVVAENGAGYTLSLPGKTHADIQDGADLRFSITYETEEESLW